MNRCIIIWLTPGRGVDGRVGFGRVGDGRVGDGRAGDGRVFSIPPPPTSPGVNLSESWGKHSILYGAHRCADSMMRETRPHIANSASLQQHVYID